MKTITSPLKIPPVPSRFLGTLDYSVSQQCMHCGLCLSSCPTYVETRNEKNSPRGRISLMRAIADSRLQVTEEFGREMYFCLGCLACSTACPAGVDYPLLFEYARAEIEDRKVLDNPFRHLVRAFSLRWLFYDLSHLQWIGRLVRLYQTLGLDRFIRSLGILKLFPQRLQDLESMTPRVCSEFSNDLISPHERPPGAIRYRVAFLTGCAQDIFFSQVNRDTVEVLLANGCEVFTPVTQSCCGSLHAHNGELEMAKELARKQLDSIDPRRFDAILTNAAGCGSHLKHFARLLKGDTRYEASAQIWDSKMKDISEWLIEIGTRKPAIKAEQIKQQRVTYHEACHLCHGQKISTQPRHLLKGIPGVELVELPEATWCCGSAGIYNITQPEMAEKLLERKLKNIRETSANVVAMGNPGCLLQVASGVSRGKNSIEVKHPVSLLAEAYRLEQR